MSVEGADDNTEVDDAVQDGNIADPTGGRGILSGGGKAEKEEKLRSAV